MGLFHPAYFKPFPPPNVKETQGLLLRLKPRAKRHAADMQAVDTQPALGQVCITQQGNPATLARSSTSQAAGRREVLSCVMELSCYDPEDGGGHFPGNEVTDSH